MASTRAAQRYAKALLNLATEKNKVDAVQKDMKLIGNTIQENRELRNVLKSPVITPEKKQGVLQAIFSKISPLTTNLFSVLARNNRIEALEKVVESFISLYNEVNNIKMAHVTSAIELTPVVEEKLLKKISALTHSKITLINTVDASLLGGFILRIGDMQYDASISGKLNSLNQKFSKNATI